MFSTIPKQEDDADTKLEEDMEDLGVHEDISRMVTIRKKTLANISISHV